MNATTSTLPANFKVTQLRVIRSEWIKFSTIKSTKITLGCTALAVIALGVLLAAFSTSLMGPGAESAAADPTGTSLAGVSIAQLILGVLGALLITNEYSTGMIRASLTAVPTRLPVLWAKVIVFGTVSFLVMLVAVLISFLGGQALYDGAGGPSSLGDPGVFRALVASAFFPAAIAIMGMALGALLRQTAAAIGVLFGLLFLAPIIFSLLAQWIGDLSAYLPSSAGQSMGAVVSQPGMLSPLMGFVVTLGWMAALLVGAAYVLIRRDA
jgi:ABC-type transport system involved in multi-copper enzyme maturation permease subunit